MLTGSSSDAQPLTMQDVTHVSTEMVSTPTAAHSGGKSSDSAAAKRPSESNVGAALHLTKHKDPSSVYSDGSASGNRDQAATSENEVVVPATSDRSFSKSASALVSQFGAITSSGATPRAPSLPALFPSKMPAEHVLVVSLSSITSDSGQAFGNVEEQILKGFVSSATERGFDRPLDSLRIVIADSLYFHSAPAYKIQDLIGMSLDDSNPQEKSQKLSKCLADITAAGRSAAEAFHRLDQVVAKDVQVYRWDEVKSCSRMLPDSVLNSPEFDEIVSRAALENFALRRDIELVLQPEYLKFKDFEDTENMNRRPSRKERRRLARHQWLKRFYLEEAPLIRYGFAFPDAKKDASQRPQVIWHPLHSLDVPEHLSNFISFVQKTDTFSAPAPRLFDFLIPPEEGTQQTQGD